MRPVLLIVAAFVVAWGAAVFGAFHFDDHSMLRDPMILRPDGWRETLRPLQTRPLTEWTFWLSYRLHGASAFGFLLWNVALHALNVALAWIVLRRLAPALALPAVLLFAVHPLQAEPVNYAFARSTLLMSAFCLLALWFWIRDKPWLACAAFAFALLAKEECVTFPFVLWILHRRSLPAVVTMLALAGAAGLRAVAATAAVAGAGAGFEAGITPLHYFEAQGVVIWRYLRLFAIPWGFTVDPQIDMPGLAIGMLGWIALVAVAAWLWRARGERWFAIGLLLLLPSSSVFPATDLAADRRMYLPLLAFACAVAARTPAKALFAFAILATGVSVYRTNVWSAEASLWREAVRLAPAKTRPRIQLARAVTFEEARQLLGQAAVDDPQNPDIPNELGLLAMKNDDPAEALSAFGRALALAPNNPQSLNNRGAALARMQQFDAAKADFLRALQADPCFAEARANLRSIAGEQSLPPCRSR